MSHSYADYVLYEKFILIERNESQINGAWKGAHLLLFFLAFVFGSFCTFCFHMLMYLFEEKCVLYPKLLSLMSLRQNIIYEFMPRDLDETDMLPVDFLSTQWVDKSVCYLPTYVPLVSGIFGLVWTTMFLMCLTGSRVLTGLQKSWRILPAVFVFSIAMGSLCIYTSVVTSQGLQELCLKLGEITGSPTCTFTINVATLLYERRIRGVYQAIKLTIVTAWLHTFCWVLSALLTLARVVLAVDFQLVRISARLKGNVDRMLEEQERLIATVFPGYAKDDTSRTSLEVTKDVPRNKESSDESCHETQHLKSSAQHNFVVILLYKIVDKAVKLSESQKGNQELPKEVDFKDIEDKSINIYKDIQKLAKETTKMKSTATGVVEKKETISGQTINSKLSTSNERKQEEVEKTISPKPTNTEKGEEESKKMSKENKNKAIISEPKTKMAEDMDDGQKVTDQSVEAEKGQGILAVSLEPNTSKEKDRKEVGSNLKENTSQTHESDKLTEASTSLKPAKKKKKKNKETQTHKEKQD